MSLKKIEQIKNGKWVSVWDIVAYAVITVAIVALILGLTLGRDKSALVGFTIEYRGETVLTYDFTTKEKEFAEERITWEEEGDVILITFTTEQKRGYNKILVNVKERTVRVAESNCSAHKDCVYTPALKNNSSAPIICTPHGLSISPLKFTDNGRI